MATRSIVVHPAASALRRDVGAQAWSELELLVASARDSAPNTVSTSVRALAVELGVSKNTAARALAVLTAAGLVSPRQQRASSGTFDAGSYRLTIPADVISVDASTSHREPTSTGPSQLRTRNAARRRDVAPAQLSLLDAG